VSDRAAGELPPKAWHLNVSQRVHGKNGSEWHGYVRTVEDETRKRDDDRRVRQSWIAALVVLGMAAEERLGT
jgi:hypothetical protein